MIHSRTFRVLFVGSLFAVLGGVMSCVGFRYWRDSRQRYVADLISRLDSAVSNMNAARERGKMQNGGDFSAAIAACSELSRLGPEAAPAVTALTRVLEGPERHYRNGDRSLRVEAAWALGRAGSEAIGPLVGSLKHSDRQVRKLAARSLGEIAERHKGKADSAIMSLAEGLTDEDVVVRMSAIEALWKFGPAANEAIPMLTKALNDENDGVRDFARHAIKQIGHDATAHATVK